MGCGPSKDANVATGNTTSTKSLQKNSIDSSNSTTITSTATNPKVDSVENGKGSKKIEDKDTTSEVEDKFIATGSPDRYFSSRKDEEAVASPAGYASHLPEISDEQKAEVVEDASDVVNGKESEDVEDNDTTSEVEGKFIAAGSPDRYFSSRSDKETVLAGYASPLLEITDEEKTEASGDNAEAAIAPKQEGKSTSKDSADLKDIILVEGKETESNVV